ncbi:MAG TPA: EAL domain-containing protein [Stellaceae bacterium]|nr:EAL domain-containing protein [Stellaceae bacterium]
MKSLADDLGRALVGDELFLVYQPKVSLGSGRWSGAEALLRWRHPERGLVPPNLFIPVAEESGLMRKLTERVIAMALDRWAEWHTAGRDIAVAINLSAKDIETDLPDRFERACAAKSVVAERITFELTETATHDVTDLLDIATRLRLKGPRLSIDDFGTGYSSVVQLHRLPFSELKIDRLFVAELEASAEARTIVRAIVDLAHALNLTTVAEGVERDGEHRFLAEIGCDEAQGFLFSRPVEAAALPAVWATRDPSAPDAIAELRPAAGMSAPL